MAASDTHYIKYDPDLIWDMIMYTYIEQGGDVLYPGDAKEMLLRTALAMAVREFAIVDNALLMDSLSFATDEYLDLKGEKKYCYRMQAQAAQATATITFAANGIRKTIPAGTALTADGQRIYVTDRDIEQTGYVQAVSVGITAEEAGAAGNGLSAGMQMQFCTPNESVQSIVVSIGATGGRDREDDDNYRERIEQYGLTSVTTGSSQQYEAAARAVSPEILDAKAVHIGPCQVCVYLVMSAGANREALITEVTNALSPDNTRPMTDLLSAAEAAEMPYVLNATCTLDSSISASTLESIKAEYQAWQDNEIGRPFDPNKFMAMLYQAGASRVQWAEGSHFNNGPVEYTAITSAERCVGTITLNFLT